MKLISTNPSANYAVLGEVDISSQSDIDSAVTKAREAFVVWSNMPLDERIAAVRERAMNDKKSGAGCTNGVLGFHEAT
jgi:acyl-CoA reductase-like NAD-dependent aldehyde dehydrogenase